MILRFSMLAAVCSLVFAGKLPLKAASEDAVDFTSTIKPMLADSCFTCHGPDQQKAGLRLDDPEKATQTLKSGNKAIVPGQPEASSLIERIFSDDPDEIMPPPEHSHHLSAENKVQLKRWIAQGAGYEQHWAYVPPSRPLPPRIRQTDWPRNAIDPHVLHQLETAGMEPSQEADPYVLLRRVYLDLIGLPPTPEQIDQYMRDSRHDRYEQLVSSLLASPQYGERWARHWLDLARYADTNGYEKDRYRNMWPYRDWVIQALNEGMPFDQFSIRQLAGDMLPDATESDRVATGFHRNTMINEEGGIDVEEFRYEAVVDRVNTTGTTWMGLAMGCAQCHGHKFDPISQTEYWQLFAIFNNADEPEIDLHHPDIEAERQRMDRRITLLQQQLKSKFPKQGDAATPAFEEAFDQWLEQASREAVSWTVLEPLGMESKFHATLTTLADHSVLASGDKPNRDIYTLECSTDAREITAIRLEALSHPSLPQAGPGRAHFFQTGDFLLSEIKLETLDASGNWVSHPFSGASDSHHKKDHEASKSLDGLLDTGWQIGGRTGEDHRAVFTLKEPIQGNGQPIRLRITLDQSFIHQVTLGRFRLSLTDHPKPTASAVSADIEDRLSQGAGQWEGNDLPKLERAFLEIAPELAEARKEIESLKKARPNFPTSLVMRERLPRHTRVTRLHHRGEFLKPRESVVPGVPELFHAWPEGRAVDRLSFAEWLFEPDNPLTARVIMNRTWQAFFGKGIVSTPEDFGYQGALPSHPEVLDWLAVEFEKSGWDMKHMHRLIVTSATYRQSSKADPEQHAADPENNLLARGPRFRVGAEMLRDIALHATGLLELKLGGPSVFPPQPAGVMDLAWGGSGYTTSQGADRYRRGLYTYWKRAAPYATFMTFDAPNPERTCARRIRSNTPLQALTLLNDEVYVEAARALAGELLGLENLTEKDRIRLAWLRLVGRPADDKVVDQVQAYLEQEQSKLRATPEDVKTLTGQSEVSGESLRHAAWILTCRALLNLDEVITKS